MGTSRHHIWQRVLNAMLADAKARANILSTQRGKIGTQCDNSTQEYDNRMNGWTHCWNSYAPKKNVCCYVCVVLKIKMVKLKWNRGRAYIHTKILFNDFRSETSKILFLSSFYWSLTQFIFFTFMSLTKFLKFDKSENCVLEPKGCTYSRSYSSSFYLSISFLFSGAIDDRQM